MSSDQTQIDQFRTALEISEGEPVPEWSPVDEGEFSKDKCQTCGNDVTEQFRRVFGDNDDVTYHCPDCSTYREMAGGGAANIHGGSP